MGRALLRAAYWLALVALWLAGLIAWQPPWAGAVMPWLDWIPRYEAATAILCLASAMTAIPIAVWLTERRHARDLQRQVRAHLTPGSFQEVDAESVLNYLSTQSAWAWNAYGRLNGWAMADHFREFELAAARGDIITVGWSSREDKVALIERRFWIDGRINQSAMLHGNGVVMNAGRSVTFSQIAVAAADVEVVWPRASRVRRVRISVWVWLKRQWFALIRTPSLIRGWRRDRGDRH